MFKWNQTQLPTMSMYFVPVREGVDHPPPYRPAVGSLTFCLEYLKLSKHDQSLHFGPHCRLRWQCRSVCRPLPGTNRVCIEQHRGEVARGAVLLLFVGERRVLWGEHELILSQRRRLRPQSGRNEVVMPPGAVLTGVMPPDVSSNG